MNRAGNIKVLKLGFRLHKIKCVACCLLDQTKVTELKFNMNKGDG